jgi:hypothetical protein
VRCAHVVVRRVVVVVVVCGAVWDRLARLADSSILLPDSGNRILDSGLGRAESGNRKALGAQTLQVEVIHLILARTNRYGRVAPPAHGHLMVTAYDHITMRCLQHVHVLYALRLSITCGDHRGTILAGEPISLLDRIDRHCGTIRQNDTGAADQTVRTVGG